MLAFSISNEILPFGSPFLALFSLVPLYTAVYTSRSARESFLVWFVQALTVHLVSSWWLYNFHDYALLTLGASALGTALQAGLCGAAAHVFPQTLTGRTALEEDAGRHALLPALRVLWFCAAYLFWEWIKSSDFLGYPWGTLSMAAYRWRLVAQIADVTGVWGISFLFCMVSALTGECVLTLSRGNTIRPEVRAGACACIARCAGILFAAALVYGAVQYVLPRTPDKTVSTIVVQQNTDTWETGERDAVRIAQELTERAVRDMRLQGKEPDLVLWSEGILSLPFPDFMNAYRAESGGTESLASFINRMGVPFVIGGTADVNRYKGHYTNAALFFDAGGSFCGFYSKIHLVPFAEGLPYESSPLVQSLLREFGIPSGYQKGNQFVLFRIPVHANEGFATPLEYRTEKNVTVELDGNGLSDFWSRQRFIENTDPNPDSFVTLSVPICFEDAFNDVCSVLYRNGSEVFMNITNDSWSKTDSSEYQHFIASSYRAIEYRTTLVRCANSGYSVVVDPAGKVIADLPLFTARALTYDVPVYRRVMTLYARCGDWFAYAVIAFLCLVTLCLFVARVYPGAAGKWQKVRRALSETDGHEVIADDSADDGETDREQEDAAPALPAETQTASATSIQPAKTPAASKKRAPSAKRKTVSTTRKPSVKTKTVSATGTQPAETPAASKKRAPTAKRETASTTRKPSAKTQTASAAGTQSAKTQAARKKSAPSAKAKSVSAKSGTSSAEAKTTAKRQPAQRQAAAKIKTSSARSKKA